MSYVGVAALRDHKDMLRVWERTPDGKRIYKDHKKPYYFYTPDPDGPYTSIFGDKLVRHDFDTKDSFDAAVNRERECFESDIPPLFKFLMDTYYQAPIPKLNLAFLDIEVDYQPELGFSSPSNPYAPINAITIWQSWCNEYITLVVPPKGWTGEDTFQALLKSEKDQFGIGDILNVLVCRNEKELLQATIELIDDADIISGWNSEFFDLPYLVQRIERVLGRHAVGRLSLPGAQFPQERLVKRFGTEEKTYTLYGRTHLDLLELFKKFTFEGRTSYALGNILAEEVDIRKLTYDGSLHQLYNGTWLPHKQQVDPAKVSSIVDRLTRAQHELVLAIGTPAEKRLRNEVRNLSFVRFVLYNVRDVEGLVKLEDKFKFIPLVNQMAHENTVLFENIKGTVRYVETGITLRAHNEYNLIVPDKHITGANEKVEGAIVMNPKIGLHRWLAGVDLVSLYPTNIRSLNMSIETFVGQFIEEEIAWRLIMLGQVRDERSGVVVPGDMSQVLRCVMDDGDVIDATAAEWRQAILQQKWGISGFGTLFRFDKPGMVADTLTFWFAERKRLQAEKKKWAKEVKRLEKELEAKPDDNELNFALREAKRQEEHYDLLQLTKKIQLNSTYGALLNEAFRFGRREIGASVTGTGRQITTFMAETLGKALGKPGTLKKTTTKEEEKIAGNGDTYNVHHYEPLSEAIIYGDTDSCYFKTGATNKADAIKIADAAAAEVNAAFPQFMVEAFNCQPGFEGLMKANREIVGSAGLFQAKKKYVIQLVDLEGMEVNKLKSQGSEIKKADTPKEVQQFLKALLDLVLTDAPYEQLEAYVNGARGTLIKQVKNVLTLAVAKQVNNLDALYAEWQRVEKHGGKVNLPGHVRAAVNYNEALQEYAPGSKLLRSGDKALILYLRSNPHGWKSIAIPAEFETMPEWFDEHFEVDLKLTEEKLIDNKIDGIFSAIGQPVPTPQRTLFNKAFRM